MNMTMNDRVLAALKATLAEPAEASGDLEEIANAKAVDVKPMDMSPKTLSLQCAPGSAVARQLAVA